jgi:hypothetical protein
MMQYWEKYLRKELLFQQRLAAMAESSSAGGGKASEGANHP